jgi:hypothetical protein
VVIAIIMADSDRALASVRGCECSEMMIKNINQVILIYEKNLPPARRAVLLVRQKESG